MMDTDECEVAELRAQARQERAYQNRLLRNPDCRDPDHPGCSACQDEEDDE